MFVKGVDVDGAVKSSRPGDVGGVEVRVGDHHCCQAAEGIDLLES